jgi:hypothetical protein
VDVGIWIVDDFVWWSEGKKVVYNGGVNDFTVGCNGVVSHRLCVI